MYRVRENPNEDLRGSCYFNPHCHLFCYRRAASAAIPPVLLQMSHCARNFTGFLMWDVTAGTYRALGLCVSVFQASGTCGLVGCWSRSSALLCRYHLRTGQGQIFTWATHTHLCELRTQHVFFLCLFTLWREFCCWKYTVPPKMENNVLHCIYSCDYLNKNRGVNVADAMFTQNVGIVLEELPGRGRHVQCTTMGRWYSDLSHLEMFSQNSYYVHPVIREDIKNKNINCWWKNISSFINWLVPWCPTL